MNKSLKSALVEKYIYWKTRGVYKELEKTPLTLPLKATEVKNVLVILPLDMERVDAAISLVNKLRKHFANWHYMMLDVEKIKKDQLNRLELPGQEFMDDLKKYHFDMVLDLNFEYDARIKYLIAMLRVPLRVRLFALQKNQYNIVIQSDRSRFKNFDFVFNNLTRIFME
ncbi:MAG: hypothetical protein Kow0042_09250 [Calditrichia bacterium]